MLEMTIHGVNLDIITNQPVLILKDKAEEKFLPIWIGQFEATAILIELQGIKSARPLTHDLLKNMLETLKANVQRIIINDIENGTFFARICLERGSSPPLEIDARPSDAVALAVRTGVPIFASEKVVEKATILSEGAENDEVARFREFLDKIGPEDFEQQTQ
jgi:bifunctional DNase/RNase